MLQVNEFKTYIDLNNEKKRLKLELKRIEKEIQSMQDQLTDDLLNNDMSKLTVGNNTVYVAKQIWASISDKNEAIKVLQQTGYGDYVEEKYNSNQLSSLLREMAENNQPIPDEFTGIIEPITKTTLRVIKA